MALLHIYDCTDSSITHTAMVRNEGRRLPVGTAEELVRGLDSFLTDGRTFDRILFETHGAPGQISLDGKSISADWWRPLKSRGYSRLTTGNARIYFNGCNVAAGRSGWTFLEAVAAVFLAPGGGEVFAHTSVGAGWGITGHTYHFWGSTRRVMMGNDGRIMERFEQ